jgi:hypothetical protein
LIRSPGIVLSIYQARGEPGFQSRQQRENEMARNVPFQREIEDLFSSDKSIVWKLLGGGFVGGALAARMVLGKQNGPQMAATARWVVFVGSIIVGMLVVLLLTLRDVVARRVDAGKPVNPILKAYFGRGNGCLMVFLWFCTIVVATLIVTIATQRM